MFLVLANVYELRTTPGWGHSDGVSTERFNLRGPHGCPCGESHTERSTLSTPDPRARQHLHYLGFPRSRSTTIRHPSVAGCGDSRRELARPGAPTARPSRAQPPSPPPLPGDRQTNADLWIPRQNRIGPLNANARTGGAIFYYTF